MFAGRPGWWGCLGLLCCWLAAAPLLAADPVDDLKQALPLDDVQNPTDAMLKARQDNLQKKIDALATIGQLRRALALDDWRDDPARSQGTPKEIRAIDNLMRAKVGQWLSEALAQQAKSGDANSRLAVANLIAEMGPNVRALKPEEKSSFARSLMPLVEKLARDADVGVRQEALRAAGSINADAKAAARIFADALQKKGGAVGPRRVAADGLRQLVRVISDLSNRSTVGAQVRATRAEVLDILQQVLQTSPLGFADADPQVRALCADAFQLAVQAIPEPNLPQEFAQQRRVLPAPGRPLSAEEVNELKTIHKELKSQIDELKPALDAIRSHAGALAPLLNDADGQVRLAGMGTLRSVADARQRLRQRVLSLLPAFPGTPADPRTLLAGADPLEPFLKSDLGAVGPLLSETDTRLRREAAIFLLLLEDRALPFVRQLTARLADPDRTIRWVAARALGNLPAEKIGEAVPYLAKLLGDDDLAVRKAAAGTLEGMGPLARVALGALAQAVLQGDAEGRIAAIAALNALGPNLAQEATPQLVAVLDQRDADPKVLVAVAGALAQIGPPARAAVPSLRRLIGHDEYEVRTAASEAILEINRAGKK